MKDEGELFETVLNVTHEAIIVVCENGLIRFANSKCCSIVKREKSQIIGSELGEVFPGLDQTREIGNYEFRGPGQRYIYRSEKLAVNGESFKALFFSSNHFNIELGNRYAEVKQLKDTYENILDSVDEGIQVADIEGRVSYINPAQKKIDGINSDVIGKHWTEVYHLDDETSLVLKAINHGLHTYDAYQNYVTRGGRYVSIICSVMPVYSGDRIIGAVAITKDYVKFKEMAERVLHLREQQDSRKNNRKSGRASGEASYTFDQILGNNKEILESIRWGKAGARSDSSVLIYGETGTGKEMVAQSIHNAGERAAAPYLAINCSAIPENLLEGILFGTTKGAFTGSIDRAGLIELTRGGTLFLDEINSMPLQLQSKLLRMIEEKKIMRLGGKESFSVDVRIVASCNTEPNRAIEAGQLRSDLFYRLAVIYIYLPPLRDRLEDLDLISNYYIQKFNRQFGKRVESLGREVRQVFLQYYWPGNVRELMHAIECAVNLVSGDEKFIGFDHLPVYLAGRIRDDDSFTPASGSLYREPPYPVDRASLSGLPGYPGSVAAPENGEDAPGGGNIIEEIQEHEKKEIVAALRQSRGNIARAAELLGMSRQRLHYRLKKYGLAKTGRR